MIPKPESRRRPAASGATAAALAVLLAASAGPAAGGWLSTTKGVSDAHSTHKSLKKFGGKLTGAADTASNAVIQGDPRQLADAEKGINRAYVGLIGDKVPILGAILDAPGKLGKLKQAAGRRIKSFFGGDDGLAALAISRDERKDYAARGITGGKRLPSPRSRQKAASTPAASAWDKLPRRPADCDPPYSLEECERQRAHKAFLEHRARMDAQIREWDRKTAAAAAIRRRAFDPAPASAPAAEPSYRAALQGNTKEAGSDYRAALQGAVETKRLEEERAAEEERRRVAKLERERAAEEERRRLARLERERAAEEERRRLARLERERTAEEEERRRLARLEREQAEEKERRRLARLEREQESAERKAEKKRMKAEKKRMKMERKRMKAEMKAERKRFRAERRREFWEKLAEGLSGLSGGVSGGGSSGGSGSSSGRRGGLPYECPPGRENPRGPYYPCIYKPNIK